MNLPKLNNMPPVQPALWKRYSKEQIEDCIRKNCGVVSLCILELDCNYKQFYRCLDKYSLRDCLAQAKTEMLDKAESVILESMNSENEAIRLKAAENVLKSKFAAEKGWGNGQNINIQQNIISDEEKKIEIKNIFGL